jgi:hypothetical protein
LGTKLPDFAQKVIGNSRKVQDFSAQGLDPIGISDMDDASKTSFNSLYRRGIS